MQDRAAFLYRIDVFADGPRAFVESVASDLEEVRLAAGQQLFAEGELGDAMYFIVDGTMRVEKDGYELLTRGCGEYVGEMALIDGGGRSAATTAATAVTLLRWTREDFRRRTAENGQMAYRICRALAAKMRQSLVKAARRQHDLERAAQVQRAILPDGVFANELIDLRAFCQQAYGVGGDFYDYLPFGDDEIALLVADVQGHGFYAALLVAMLKTSLHSQAARDRRAPAVVAALNRTILRDVNEIFTTTCCYVRVDRRDRTLDICSAGHLPQFHYHAASDELRRIESTCPLLGLPGSEDWAFKADSRTWSPGDLLVLFTDGLTEARSTAGEELGDERMVEIVRQHRHQEPQVVQEALRRRLVEFCEERYHDDVTLVVARLA